jgi:hypothetical protein
MVHVSFIGRLGNNLIQYSLARFLAESKGYRLTYDEIGQTGVNSMFELFPNTRVDIRGREVLQNSLVVGYDDIENRIQMYDLDKLLLHDGLIHLRGFFQKHKLFIDHKNTICKYFHYDASSLRSGNDHDVVIHIRLGDYVILNHYIHPSKIHRLYKDLGFKNALVLSEDVTSPLLVDFHNDPTCTIQCNSLIQDLHFLATCSNIIISQSTFSWWGSYFGIEKKIYIPYDSDLNYPWPLEPQDDEIDLIPNKKNYLKVIL